ncbi:MAG: alanine racemase [Alcaligenaceae bacterium]|nr:alanine racemase [Alcaligenaceae bacterium]
MPRPISATISLPFLTHNLAVVRNQLDRISTEHRRVRPKIWAVIKANAYGHGIHNALRAFDQADGLAMLDLAEAIACREAGWVKPILLLEGFFDAADINLFSQYSLDATVHCQTQLDMLSAVKVNKPVNVFLKLNTGMNRLGFEPDRFRSAWDTVTGLQRSGTVGRIGKMTHFARADEAHDLTHAQIRVFAEATHGLPGPDSMCNSAASLTPAYWLSLPDTAEQWVRPGICLYGSSPFTQQTSADLELKPGQTLSSRLISVRSIGPGEGVGYGHIFVAEQPMRIGVVACGYADGYPRHAPTGTPVSVAGVRTRLLGRVSMDMLTVDLGPVPQARVGDDVVLWGQNGPTVDEVASAAGTIGYELLCAVAPRVPKLVVS